MVRLTFALLPSPLLGPEAWGPVAEVLRSGGWSVLEQPGAAEPPGAPGDVLKRFLAALPTDRDLVLVPHSNAGLYVPELTMRIDSSFQPDEVASHSPSCAAHGAQTSRIPVGGYSTSACSWCSNHLDPRSILKA
jgi:hypothetical protein